MITLSLIKNSGAAAKYYTKEDNYYLAEADAKEASLWYGRGAVKLNLQGKVAEQELQQVLQGHLPNGVIVGLRKDGSINHRGGYDLCFHAPKSVSILALEGEDSRLYDAHLAAVKETLALIEADCAQVKVVTDEEVNFEKTQNLTIALVRHIASREQDPHLHHHALVMNATQKADGNWRALASNTAKTTGTNGFSENVYKNQIYYSMIYKTSLASKVVQLGYQIAMVDGARHGMWEIKGVPKAAIAAMSKRTQQIQERIEKLNYRSLKAADIASLDTRSDKPSDLQLADIKTTWTQELLAAGFSSQEFIAQTKQQSPPKLVLESAKIEEIAKQAVNYGIEQLSQYQLKLDYAKLVTAGLEFAMGQVNHLAIIKAVDAAITQGDLIALDQHKTTLVTKQLLATETAIMDLVAASKLVSASINVTDRVINQTVGTSNKELALAILQDQAQLNLVAQRSDQTDLIANLLTLAESSGKTLRVVLPNRLMAADINENIRRKPSNLWQWLVALGKPAIGECLAGFKHRYQEEAAAPLLKLRQGKEVIVISDTEVLASEDLRKLLEVTKLTQAKVIFLHDPDAKAGFTAGNAVTTLKQAGINTITASNSKQTVNYTPEVHVISDDQTRLKHLVQIYATKSQEQRQQSLVLVGAKAQIQPTTAMIRDALKQQQQLAVTDYNIPVLNTVHLTKPESTLAHKYHPGMIVRFYDQNKLAQDWQVKQVIKTANMLRLVQGEQEKLWRPQSSTSIALLMPSELALAKGDQVITTSKMPHLGLKSATKLQVKAINQNQIELRTKHKTIKLNLDQLKDSHLQHNYVTTLNQTAKTPVEHVLIDIKSYLLDQPTLHKLTTKAQKSALIFTNNATTIPKQLTSNPIKLTATQAVLDAGHAAGGTIPRMLTDQTLEALKTDLLQATAVLTQYQPTKQPLATLAVNFALEKITTRSAGFSHQELVTQALLYAMQTASTNQADVITRTKIETIIQQKYAAGELIMGQHFRDGTIWTTPEILALEQTIVQNIKQGQCDLLPLFTKQQAAEILKATTLTPDQQQACHLITTTSDKFTIIQGYAGTGKTTMLAQVQKMLSQTPNQSLEILALAPTHRAVAELKKVTPQAQTLKSFLTLGDTKSTAQQTSAASIINHDPSNQITSLDNKLIVLDEASMVSNQDFAQFLTMVNASNSRVVLSGDIAQHLAIEAGKPFEMLQQAGIIKTAYLREIVRQTNPVLKDAVKLTIDHDYAGAAALIASDDPRKHVARTQESLFIPPNQAIVEIDNKQVMNAQAGTTLEQALVADFLSRTPEAQNNTAIIVHCHQDRATITKLLRDGLKQQGVIAPSGNQFHRLNAKNLTRAEQKLITSYEPGDTVKLGSEYYYVTEINQASTSVLLTKEDGAMRSFHPQHANDIKSGVELYHHTKAELATGDVIRITKTNKARGLYANFEYTVKDVNATTAKLVSDGQTELNLSAKELSDAHWDYAQTVTGYGIQGASRPLVIDYEVSYRKNLAHQRSFYIGITRAIKQLTIYTDNKAKLLQRITNNPGDKYSALELTQEVLPSTSTTQTKSVKSQTPDLANFKPKPHYDAQAITISLSNMAESLVKKLLGKPNEKLSSSSEWRYGHKGSLAITMSGDKKGLWYNFETGQSGNLLQLIQTQMGLAFNDALKYAGDIVNFNAQVMPSLQIKSPENVTKITTNDQQETSKYAQKLVTESLPIKGTIVEQYLKEIRKINNLDNVDIRYHPNVHTGKDIKPQYAPAMLAIGRDQAANIQCVQATYLDPNTANKADLMVTKRTYASPSGALVALQNNPKTNLSFIAEGMETGLSIKDAVKNNDVFVTLGKTNFAKLNPDKLGNTVVFCLDNDGTKTLTDNAIHQASQRLLDHGKEVFIAMPEAINRQKTDFNDVVKHSGIQAVKDTLNQAMIYSQWRDKFMQKPDIFDRITSKINDRALSTNALAVEKPTNTKTVDFSTDNQQATNKNILDTQKILSKIDREI